MSNESSGAEPERDEALGARAAPSRIVIVGGGIAGYSAAAALRNQHYAGELVIVSDEKHLPYDRPPLSKAVLKSAGEEPIPVFQPSDWYSENGIELVLGDRAIAVSAEDRKVTLKSGRLLDYDQLLLATGARARRLPALEATGVPVHYLRSLDDCLALRPLLQGRSRVAVIGAGVIGMEVAATATELECQVTVVEAAGRVMARSLSPALSEWIAERHREHGVRILCGTTVTGASVAPSGTTLGLSDGGVLEADVIIAGVGAEPVTELAETAGLDVNDGILVDHFARTSDPAIYAVGDAVRFRSIIEGQHLRAEHWRHAVDHGNAVAAIMLGGDQPYEEQPWVWSDQFNLNIQIIGSGTGDREVVRGEPSEKGFIAFQLLGGRLIGAVLVNQGRHRRLISGLVASRPRIPPEALANEITPLAALKSLGEGEPVPASKPASGPAQ